MAERNDDRHQAHRAGQQMLRLVTAVYFMGLAMGALPQSHGMALLAQLVPAQFAPPLFSVGLFGAAYLILIGRHLRRASLGLVAFIILTRLNTPLNGLQATLLAEALLVASLLYTGGWIMRSSAHSDAPGRIRLTRITPPRGASTKRKAAQKAQAARAKPGHGPFTQSPEELSRLFDQLRVIR